MYPICTLHDADYSGRVTVPVLWDKQQPYKHQPTQVVPVGPELDFAAGQDE